MILRFLADFGVSKTLQSDFVNATNYIGSPLFMAPEVIRKDKYNHKTDIWYLFFYLPILLSSIFI